MKPLVEFAIITGKRCQNAEYDWHVYPKTRKKNKLSDEENDGTFIILIKKTNKVCIFCYHCFLSTLGEWIRDLRLAGATNKEISAWILPSPNIGHVNE